MTVRDDRSDVRQTTTGFRDPRHLIYQKQIPIPLVSLEDSNAGLITNESASNQLQLAD